MIRLAAGTSAQKLLRCRTSITTRIDSDIPFAAPLTDGNASDGTKLLTRWRKTSSAFKRSTVETPSRRISVIRLFTTTAHSCTRHSFSAVYARETSFRRRRWTNWPIISRRTWCSVINSFFLCPISNAQSCFWSSARIRQFQMEAWWRRRAWAEGCRRFSSAEGK